ncbi:MAG TPA: glucose-6-phosphate dehydrogenase assembly protein OpcA [Candidatus Agrococcus pullicola]|uniref:Glucose-6-phosphate dehydrogenase assembly protein OpcA n=1 Tax=Candidatus Agrococcus pullicola TaxID=2838429 RepID=A0A9D1YUX9_9MICO|nr:glucose-6-phosphate dehydrogenase assembly protein OpcA [Candidatus Agrococcus pullicola]
MIKHLEDTNTSAVIRTLDEIREEGGVVALGRVLTLLIHTQTGAEEDAIEAANDASREHPMRVIVISRNTDDVRAKEAPRLDAEIRVGGDAGASEVVLLQCRGEVGSRLIGVVQGLLLPDAPIVAWWPTFMPTQPAESQLGSIAHRRITDTGAQQEPRAALRALADGYTPGDTDLSWTRLTNWRAHLAAMLDQPPYTPVSAVTVCGSLDNPSVHLMSAWLHCRLRVPVQLRPPETGMPIGSSGLSSIVLERGDEENSLTRIEHGTGLMRQTGQPDHRVALSRRGLRDQLSEELRRLDADEMYREVLADFARLDAEEGPKS